MSAIEIKGLTVSACHGVNPSEKTQPQPFVFDIYIDCDTMTAAVSDDIEKTVNYSAVCNLVNDFCRSNSFNLIERLAHGAAYLIAEKNRLIDCVTVTVHKPHAPIKLPFSDVSATATVRRVTAVLSLGSSLGDRSALLNTAIEKIDNVRGLKVKKISSFIETDPVGGVAENKFLNCALAVECLLPPRALLSEMQKIETELGRVRNRRWEDRTLDVDLIFYGNRIIAEEGLCVPHPHYASRSFVIGPVKEILPDFVCPVTRKRMSDL